jgi:hypothetical protein
MSAKKLSEEDLAQIHALAKGWGKIVVREAFGEAGPGLDVDLEMMEEVAVAAVRGLTEGTLGEATRLQADRFGHQEACPECGTMAERQQESRAIVARTGRFDHDEPVYHCHRCRRSFFPAAAGPSARRPRL